VVILETILILSLLILVHEFGHFLMAKLLGIKVLTFSLGFGPKLMGKKWKDTDFLLSLIPFGGYVKMAGDEPEEGKEYKREEFLGRPVPQRLLVVISGPVANLFLGFILFFVAYSAFGLKTFAGNEIGEVKTDSPAFKAGLKEGDKIIEIDGESFKNWDFFYKKNSEEGMHRIGILRNGDTLIFEIPYGEDGEIGISPRIPPVVGRVLPGTPASSIGLKEGDTIISLNNLRIKRWEDIVKIVREHPEDTLPIEWKRGGEIFKSHIVPEAYKKGDQGKTVGRIGIMALTLTYRPSIGEALLISIEKTISSTYLIFQVLYKLIIREVSVKTIGGPVMIGKLVGETSSFGMFSLLILVGLISVNLFVINIIPFPVLDGGHILFYTIEGLRKKPLSPRVQTIIQQVGFGILILLMIAITFFDLARIFKK
jgi:regulator of sigma E protease